MADDSRVVSGRMGRRQNVEMVSWLQVIREMQIDVIPVSKFDMAG